MKGSSTETGYEQNENRPSSKQRAEGQRVEHPAREMYSETHLSQVLQSSVLLYWVRVDTLPMSV